MFEDLMKRMILQKIYEITHYLNIDRIKWSFNWITSDWLEYRVTGCFLNSKTGDYEDRSFTGYIVDYGIRVTNNYKIVKKIEK